MGDCVTFILYYNSINGLGDVVASPLIKEHLHSPLGRGSGNAYKALWSQSAAFPAFLEMVLGEQGDSLAAVLKQGSGSPESKQNEDFAT